MQTRTQRKSGGNTSTSLLKLVTTAKVRLRPHRLTQLRFHLYTVEGTLDHVRRTFRVVCCHGADARAMIVQRLPAIDKLKVTRGKPVDYIAIGDHLLYQ